MVNAALNRDKWARERPDDTTRVQIEFSLLGDNEGAPLRNCKVVAWDPPAPHGGSGRDVAGLVLIGGDALPEGAGPARLLDTTVEQTEVSFFGYPGNPPGRVKGVWSSCRLRGAVGGGLIQLDVDNESALRVQPGYSGAPAVVTDGGGDAVIGMLAIASRDGSERDAYALPLEALATVWPRVLRSKMVPPCPYPGLRAFSAADARAGVFVGRENEVERLRAMVKAQLAVIVAGPSGVGKSSLVAAGLAPILTDDGWAVASFRPGATPFDAVAKALLDLERPAGEHSLEDLRSRVTWLRRDGFWEVASRLALLTDRRIALIGDQFEEIFSFAKADEVIQFLRTMLPDQDSPYGFAPVRLVCTLRADFLPALLDIPDIGPRLQDRQLSVSPLDVPALTRVIVEPADLVGVTYASDLAETIARDAGQGPGGLPLLEFALTELWPLQLEKAVNFDHYHALGGVSGALNRHAEKVYRTLAEQLDETRIRRVLLALVRARGGAASAVRIVGRRAHLGADWRVAEMLAAPGHRMIVLGPDGPDTAEIAHEALIREWKRLADWVDEDAEFQQWLTVVEDRATEDEPLSEARLAEAQRWLSERKADIPAEVADHVARSRVVVESRGRTEQLLSESQRLAQELQHQQAELRRTNAELEDKAALLAKQNRAIETQNFEIEQAHRTLEERAEELQRGQAELRRSNAELEDKAALLAKQNRAIEIQNFQIEQAHRTLEERAEGLALSLHHKSKFVANMSHELRTPLNSLLVLAKLLSENPSGNLTAKQVEFAKTIYDSGTDLLQLINDILDLSKVEAGKLEVRPQRLELGKLVDYVEATFRPMSADKGLDFDVRVAPSVPETLLADEQRLQQVLRNLLSNAVKFTSDGAVCLDITRGNAPSTIAFSVTDTGIGISEDKLEIIFEAFQQADGTTSRRYGGTGLGLSISRDIARLLGGEIQAASQPGEGSTFTLILPAAYDNPDALNRLPLRSPAMFTEPANTNEENELDATLSGRKVLIVDDDVRNVFALTSVLEGYGMDVIYAENGRSGIDVLQRNPDTALVLMDIMMPELDGYATTETIRKMPQFSELPIIVITAKVMKGDREKSMTAGASDHLPKPFDVKHLLDVIRNWLCRRLWAMPRKRN